MIVGMVPSRRALAGGREIISHPSVMKKITMQQRDITADQSLKLVPPVGVASSIATRPRANKAVRTRNQRQAAMRPSKEDCGEGLGPVFSVSSAGVMAYRP